MSRSAYSVPGTASGRQMYRDDLPRAVAEHGASLPGDPGNYRSCKFPGTETALFKTNIAMAFRNKPWFPTCFILPTECDALQKEIETGGNSKTNYWICKPKNDYGGSGITVCRGTDECMQQ